jgi:transketolase
MPSWELFRTQKQSYRDEILPPDVKARLAVEAGAPLGWHEWVGEAGAIIGIAKFGASAPYQEIFKHYGFTVENIIAVTKKLL